MASREYPPFNDYPDPGGLSYEAGIRPYDLDLSRQLKLIRTEIKRESQAIHEKPTFTGPITNIGTGLRFSADFTSSPPSLRYSFQTSVLNGASTIQALPNGTGAGGIWSANSKSDVDNSSYFYIRHDGTNAILQSAANGTGAITRYSIRINSVEMLAVPTGGGLEFPAVQKANANANTLDDYEEGAFTPFLHGQTTAGSFTYSIAVGRYTKIGNLVHIQFRLLLASITVAPTGPLSISGLPFIVVGPSGEPGGLHLPFANGWNTAPNGMFLQNGLARADPYKLVAGTFNRTSNVPADLTAGSDMNAVGTYTTTT
jgi:hypothetical protein